jgi:diguanylate cyclase (GGDEF)-like protein
MLDIDLFKKINDRFGHNIGDDALKTVSQVCLASLRETDLFGRLGGEEFAALLIDCNQTQAIQTAERMRNAVSIAEVLTPKENLRLTISVGVSSSNYTLDLEKLIKEADQAMYKAKETGRNRVCSFIQ